MPDKPPKQAKRRFGRILEWSWWLEIIVERAAILLRLVVRGLRSFFD